MTRINFVFCLARIPVPDLRPKHDMQRCPWWKRNVRDDYLELRLEEPFFTYSVHSKQPASRIDLSTSNLDLFYYVRIIILHQKIGRYNQY